MKRNNYRKYQAPRVREAGLETEGVLCGSLGIDSQVDMLENVNARSASAGEEVEKSYFEF